MKAAVLKQFGSPLEVGEVEVPSVGPDDVLVRVRACGVCGTDLKIASGKIPYVQVPLIPGHEVAGEIVRVGEQVSDKRVGDRVGLHLYVTCGRCRFCKKGLDSLCENLTGQIGFTLNGGLAEFIKVPAVNALPLGDAVSFPEAAVLPDAVATPYQAITRHAGIQPGEVLVLVGAGGLGLHAVQIGKALGAFVIAVDVVEAHLEKARELGADVTLNADRDNIIEAVRVHSEGRGADVVVDMVGRHESLERDLECLSRAGRLVVVGYDPTRSFSVPSVLLVGNSLRIMGCRASTKADLAEMIRWVAEKKMRPVIEDILPLARVNEVYERIRNGQVMGRIVVNPSGA